MTCTTCHQPIHWSHAERWYHDSPAATLTCPAVTIEPDVFGQLTNAELMQLSHTLSSGSHAAHNITVCFERAAGLFPIGTPAEERIWDARRAWVALADECADLAADCRATRAALAVKMAADA